MVLGFRDWGMSGIRLRITTYGLRVLGLGFRL